MPVLWEVKMHCSGDRLGIPTFVALSFAVAALMVLSLLITATGTARFTVAMRRNHSAITAPSRSALARSKHRAPRRADVGTIPRSFGFAAIFGVAWAGLVTFSWLATHATVSTAIAAIERGGTWKMEVRSNTKAELVSLEQQLAALSRPAPPRPAKTVREALAAEPRASQRVAGQPRMRRHPGEHPLREGLRAQVVQLRRELAASRRRSAPHLAACCRSGARKASRCLSQLSSS